MGIQVLVDLNNLRRCNQQPVTRRIFGVKDGKEKNELQQYLQKVKLKELKPRRIKLKHLKAC